MGIFYFIIDILVMPFDDFCLILLLSNSIDHKKHIAKTAIIYILYGIATYVLSAVFVIPLVKSFILMVFLMLLYRLLLSENMAVVGINIAYSNFFMDLSECMVMLFYKMQNISFIVEINGAQYVKWQALLISRIMELIFILVLKRTLKPFSEVMEKRSALLPIIISYAFCGLSEMVRFLSFQQEETAYILIGISALAGIGAVSFILYMYSARLLYSEQKEREERLKVEVLEKQFAYYLEKQRDEERVRAVYHDMKNHLLVLEHQIHSPETAAMIEKLQQEVEMYEDYVHTGNDILDVIIKDKSKLAREKNINLSVAVDLNGLDFIEPLDISTIFGNGLDNAIEASEKLPDGQGVILVKAGRVQNFLSILIENNCGGSAASDGRSMTAGGKRTSKDDDYLHGFGISNMKNAADKYGGQLTAGCENDKFILKILIPIPDHEICESVC